MNLDLPTKKIRENFASNIEMRQNKLTLKMDLFVVILGLMFYFINRLQFKFSKRKIKMFQIKTLKPLKRSYYKLLPLLIFLVLASTSLAFSHQPQIEAHRMTADAFVSPMATITPSISPTPTPSAQISPKRVVGHVSHYSRAGCLGCSVNFTMANGETLNDDALTIAVPPGWFPMNSIVKVTNLDNGKSVIAKVTDTGGFLKYNRIADLTLAVGKALETKTDVSEVEVVLNE